MSFAGLGHLEPAAILAAADTRTPRSAWTSASAHATAVDAALLAGLNEQELATLRDRGANLDNDDLVAYLRAEADRALAE